MKKGHLYHRVTNLSECESILRTRSEIDLSFRDGFIVPRYISHSVIDLSFRDRGGKKNCYVVKYFEDFDKNVH